MAIYLNTLRLPDNLRWLDEFQWTRHVTSQVLTLQGRLTRTQYSRAGETGRPISLGSDTAKISLATLRELHAMADAAYHLSLSLHDHRSYSVLFRFSESPIIETEPVVKFADPRPHHWFTLHKLKLEVQ